MRWKEKEMGEGQIKEWSDTKVRGGRERRERRMKGRE